ncbi:aldo/keto reductase [Trametes polyzona]|nr:aldo/keto reductase [Trametes polyzona]
MVTTTKLGGTASDIVVAKVIGSYWVPKPPPEEQAFEAIKAGINALPPGVKMVLNRAQLYGKPWTTHNLEMLSRFFEKYPDYAERASLMVEGGFNSDKQVFDNSAENLRRSVDTCLAALRGKKTIDVFQPARVDKSVGIDVTMKTLVELKNEGKFDHIGVSECAAATIRRAHAVYPIARVEIEISPTSYAEETKRVIATCAKLDIAVAGYSCATPKAERTMYRPLGHGLLTGHITKKENLDPNDFRNQSSRFQEENLRHNLDIADAIRKLAKRNGCTPRQLCIGWVGSPGGKVLPLPGSATSPAGISSSPTEKKEIAHILKTHPVKGGRYRDGGEESLWGKRVSAQMIR